MIQLFGILGLALATTAFLVKVFLEKPIPPDYLRTGVSHDYTRQCWGHALHGPIGKGFIAGHGPLLGTIKEGDWVLVKMQSGRVGRLLIYVIQYERDPPDMWRANYVNDGYQE